MNNILSQNTAGYIFSALIHLTLLSLLAVGGNIIPVSGSAGSFGLTEAEAMAALMTEVRLDPSIPQAGHIAPEETIPNGDEALNEEKAEENKTEQKGDTVLAQNPGGSLPQGTAASGTTGGKGIGTGIANGDTSGLGSVYAEGTLNVRMRYPSGWKFIDQNRKSKLDGVTFIGYAVDPANSPYVILQVKEKYLFRESKYKNKEELKNYTIYYNDPEELEGQVSQTLYIRTEGDEDYSIKLIVNGMDRFKDYQPVFFSMIKSFRFGSSFF